MKNTKFLFDESKYTPEGMVSVSQLQTFLSCRKKWEYGYIEEITTRVDREYLTIGKLCHKGMQAAMQFAWEDQQKHDTEDAHTLGRWKWWRNVGLQAIGEEFDKYMTTVPMLDQEVAGFENILTDAERVFSQAFEEFEPWKYRILTVCKQSVPSPALELHFKVPCPPTKGLHGYIDAILQDMNTGFIWCTDYKFRKSLSPDSDEANNIQNAVYAYACSKMGIQITGTMTWQHLNTPAAYPQILKDGRVSRAKIKTTWPVFAEFCVQNFIDPEPYEEEMQDKLADIEWFRPTYEYRNQETVERIWQECVLPVAKSVKAAHGKNANNFRSLYPWNCKMCQYQSLCQAELRDYDADYIRSSEYVKRSHAVKDNKPIDEAVAT